jgi:hypothetical protein
MFTRGRLDCLLIIGRAFIILILPECSHAKITNETVDWKTDLAAKRHRSRKIGDGFLRFLRFFAAK